MCVCAHGGGAWYVCQEKREREREERERVPLRQMLRLGLKIAIYLFICTVNYHQTPAVARTLKKIFLMKCNEWTTTPVQNAGQLFLYEDTCHSLSQLKRYRVVSRDDISSTYMEFKCGCHSWQIQGVECNGFVCYHCLPPAYVFPQVSYATKIVI